MKFTILALNIGSTSLKTAVFEDEKELVREQITYDPDKINRLKSYNDWLRFHRDGISGLLRKHETRLKKVDMVVSRGALTRPIESGPILSMKRWWRI